MAIILLPISLVMNFSILGSRYVSDWRIFGLSTLITSAAFAICFICSGGWAVLMKKRFPDERQLGLKFTFMLLTFFAFTGLLLYFLFRTYTWMP
jgi:hypothetical protein